MKVKQNPRMVRMKEGGKTKKDKYTRGGVKFDGYNKPKRTPGASKEMAVLAKKGDTVKLVRYGDPDMSVKKDQKGRKKSYCARSSGIKGADSKLSANYWSRRRWGC
jgi:hypothetical protein